MRPASLSPLELLLPTGIARTPLVLGTGCPSRLLPGLRLAGVAWAVDLAILAPTAAECGTVGWLRRAVGELAKVLAPDGLVYVLAPRPWRWWAAHLLRRAGLRNGRAFLHTPDHVSDHHYVVPVSRGPMDYALSTFLPAPAWKQTLTRILLWVPGGDTVLAQLLPSIGFIARRSDVRAGAEWLFSLSARASLRNQAISVHFDGQRATAVVILFAGRHAFPMEVAKLPLSPPVIDRAVEARLLSQLGPDAERAGAWVPRLVVVGQLGEHSVLVETAVQGRPLSALLRERPGDHLVLLEQVMQWLERWNARTASVRPLASAWLNAEVLQPLDRVSPLLAGGQAYRGWLSRRCFDLADLPVPFVATHNDLTAGNILLDRRRGLGIVDWEMARPNDLPLLDFLYLATETTAALNNYLSWADAFESCFAPAGRLATAVMALQDRLVRALELPAELVELCLHVCWIRRVARDLHQPRSTRELPFLPILQRLASQAAAEQSKPPAGIGTGK